MEKAGPYVGPRGGKWADPKHTIPWKDKKESAYPTITDEMLDRLKEKGIPTHRRSGQRLTGTHIVQMADDPDRNEHYGNHVWVLAEKLDPIPDHVFEFASEYYGVDVDDIRDEVDPADIVASAGAWDDDQFVSDLWQFLERRGEEPVGFKTQDGAVVFPGNESKLKHFVYQDGSAEKYEKSFGIKKTFEIHGMTIAVETPRGAYREWYDPANGESGKTRMLLDYGYIENTRGSRAEGMDEYDVFVGPDHDSPFVFVVHQMKRPLFEEWDEDKALLGLRDAEMAKRLYLAHYNDPRFFGSMSIMSIDEFKAKVMRTKESDHTGLVRSMDFDALVMDPMRKIPDWMGDSLEKAGKHKYVRRVPTGKDKPKYKYFYKVTGGKGLGSKEEFQVGSAFQISHEGKGGHFHVVKVDGNDLVVRHDESGKESVLSRDALTRMLHSHHAEKIEEESKKVKQAEKKADKTETKKDDKKAEKRKEKFEARFGGALEDKETPKKGHTVSKKFPWGKADVTVERVGQKWVVSFKNEDGSENSSGFKSISAAARHVFANTKGHPDQKTYEKETGKKAPGVSWNFFGIKDRTGGSFKLQPKEGPHNERLKLGDMGGLEGAAKLQTFRTKEEARLAAESIGWPAKNIMKLGSGLSGLELPGGMKLGKWALVEGEGDLVTTGAFDSLQSLPDSDRSPPKKPKVEREYTKTPRSPDSFPKGGAPKVVDMIAESAGIDLGAIDPDESGVREHFMSSASGIVPDKKIQNAKTVRDMMIETIRAAKKKDWRGVDKDPAIGQDSILEHFRSLPQLDKIRIPDHVAERHLIEDQQKVWDAESEDYLERENLESEKELSTAEIENLADDALDFNPDMFFSLTFARRLKPEGGRFVDENGEAWERTDDLEKSIVVPIFCNDGVRGMALRKAGAEGYYGWTPDRNVTHGPVGLQARYDKHFFEKWPFLQNLDFMPYAEWIKDFAERRKKADRARVDAATKKKQNYHVDFGPTPKMQSQYTEGMRRDRFMIMEKVKESIPDKRANIDRTHDRRRMSKRPAF
jgi:hypothetical protein